MTNQEVEKQISLLESKIEELKKELSYPTIQWVDHLSKAGRFLELKKDALLIEGDDDKLEEIRNALMLSKFVSIDD